jgi:hypothetical protein
MTSVTGLVESDVYADVVERICVRAKIRLYPGYPPPMQEMDRKSVEASGFSVAELREILESEAEKLARFSVAKIEKMRGVPTTQEYRSGEEPDEDETDVAVADRGYAKGFLLVNLVEYALVTRRPADLDAFLKRRRTPAAKKYAALLRELLREG